MGGVIVLLTRGMGEQLIYGIPARYRVVLMERLGGSKKSVLTTRDSQRYRPEWPAKRISDIKEQASQTLTLQSNETLKENVEKFS